MIQKLTGKEVEQNMKYLLKLLHKEWERSGKTYAEMVIPTEDAKKVKLRMVDQIGEQTKELELDEVSSFQKSIALSKETYVLLRLGQKILQAEEKAQIRGSGSELYVGLDREEYRLFQAIVIKGGGE